MLKKVRHGEEVKYEEHLEVVEHVEIKPIDKNSEQ
jgi:hypothetical protein